VTVYDGYTTRDPILLRFCGSGETVPVTTSSGPELLVQFSTSPYGTLMYPFGPLHGFQLQVQVSTHFNDFISTLISDEHYVVLYEYNNNNMTYNVLYIVVVSFIFFMIKTHMHYDYSPAYLHYILYNYFCYKYYSHTHNIITI